MQSNSPLQQSETGGISEAASPVERSADGRVAKLSIEGSSSRRGDDLAAGVPQFLLDAAGPAAPMDGS